MKESRPNLKRRATADDVAIGQKLRALRLDRGLSQSEVGSLVGVTFQQMQKYENGMNRISAGRLVRIAAALRLPVTAFYAAAAARKSEGAFPICARPGPCASCAPMRGFLRVHQSPRWSRLPKRLPARGRRSPA